MIDLRQHTINNQQETTLMDDIIAVRDDLWAQKNTKEIPVIIPGELSEAFALLDPDLAALHKEMKTAAAQVAHAKKTKQPMADMLLWRYESAESAYQTRLIEVRKNKLMRKAAKRTLNGEEIEAKRELMDITMQQRMNDEFAALRKRRMEEKRRKEEKDNGFYLYFLIGLWMAQMDAKRRTHDLGFSKLQAAFFNARTA